MNIINPNDLSRRVFLRRAVHLSATGIALPTALSLAAMGEAAAFSATDYKALVCVFLNGANDHYNTVVAYDNDSYNAYQAIRGGGVTDQSGGGIAIARSSLSSTLLEPTVALPGGKQFALNPTMTGLAGLFNSGKAAVQLNVGPLLEPTNKAQFINPAFAKRLPTNLFSHNDQQSIWQSFGAEGTTVGWGGNLGDLALGSNGSSSLFTCVSATGNTVFLAGDQSNTYQINSAGAIKVTAPPASAGRFNTEVPTALNRLLALNRSNLMERDYSAAAARSILAETTISGALSQGQATTTDSAYAPFAPVLAGNGLAGQMRIVARMIAARQALGVKRQVFFVSVGGFDHHDNLMANHPGLIKQVSDAMTAFYQTTVNLGIDSNVTTFTASDFGRTLSSNGDGSDHGWGSHHFIVGGAVKGKSFYGNAPPVGAGATNSTSASDQWQVGQGRLLPTTSVDQMAATLGGWFGVDNAELGTVFPNLNNFGTSQDGINYPKNMGYFG